MTKKSASVMVSLVLLTLLLSGCKLPASQAPTETGEAMTTPINIQTDSPISMTQTAIAKTSRPQPSLLVEPRRPRPQTHRNLRKLSSFPQ